MPKLIRLKNACDCKQSLIGYRIFFEGTKMYGRRTLSCLILLIVLLAAGVSMSAESNDEVNKLISDYSDNQDLASTLIYTASDYAWNKRYEEAERLYREVIDREPNDIWGLRARLGISRLKVLNLIAEKSFSEAKKELDSMVSEFSGDTELAVALFHIGQEFGWQRRYCETRDAFDRVIKDFPGSEIIPKARLWRARANVCVIIRQTLPVNDSNAIQTTDEDVLAAVDAFLEDFETNPGLPEAMHWISQEYEWTKWAPGGSGDANARRYDLPNSVYQKLSQRFSQTDYGLRADWDSKRMAHRTKILTLMEEGDQEETDSAIEQMVDEFSGRAEVPGELCRIAIWYEQHNKFDEAGEIYERIVAEFPDTNIAEESVQDVVRLTTEADKSIDSDEAISQLAARLRNRLGQTPQLASALCAVGGEYQRQAQISEQIRGDSDRAKALLQKAVQIYDEAIKLAGDCESSAEVELQSGNCPYKLQKLSDALLKLGWINFRQGDFQEAVSFFEKGLAKLPQENRPTDVLYAMGKIYENTNQPGRALEIYEQLQKMLPSGTRLDKINEAIDKLKKQQ